MYTEILQSVGLAQNEARIYEALLKRGELSVSEISVMAKVHRRNVYDSLARLSEKGLVFEVIDAKESRYTAVEPAKLADMLAERQDQLQAVLPELESLHAAVPQKQSVMIYRGTEGWRTYMRDVLRIGGEVSILGAKGSTSPTSIQGQFAGFLHELKRKGIVYHCLYDAEIKGSQYEGHLGGPYRFLPKELSGDCAVCILEDRIFLFSDLILGGFQEDVVITVVVNPSLAAAYRKWFGWCWQMAQD